MFRRAADQGDAHAQNNLGIMYLNGLGVTQDYRQALELFRRVADQGLAGAQFNLGGMYLNGLGVPRDRNRAIEYLVLAARQGHERAQSLLAELGILASATEMFAKTKPESCHSKYS